jgi:hypothetical protein
MVAWQIRLGVGAVGQKIKCQFVPEHAPNIFEPIAKR